MTCRWPRVVEGLDGVTVRAVETRGKNLLVRFESAQTLRVHLKMSGRWSFYAGDDYSLEDLGLAFDTPEGSAVCRNVPDVERIDDRLLPEHPLLSALGPDVLGEGFDPTSALARARPDALAGEVLLDQRVACGLGNVYRAEVLFLERVNPWTPLGEVPRAERLWARGLRLMRANCRPGPRNTTGQRRPELWVYNRAGQPCVRCGARIEVARIGADLPRNVWWCPRCQPGGS